MGVTVWLVKWSRQTEEEQGSRRYLAVVVLLTLSALVVSLLRTILTFFSLVKVGGSVGRPRKLTQHNPFPAERIAAVAFESMQEAIYLNRETHEGGVFKHSGEPTRISG